MASHDQERQEGNADLTLSTYVQYVEDFKFWVYIAGRPHRIPDKEIAKCYVNGLKPELFREEMYSRSFEFGRCGSQRISYLSRYLQTE